jgi:hypothetical protein
MADETFDIGAEDAAALGALADAFNPRAGAPPAAAEAPEPDTWELEGGWAWVWRLPGNDTLTKPVIIADGFSGGSSKLDEWKLMWAQSGSDIHHWGTQLHEHGHDVVVVGYEVRDAAILDNANVAIECIRKVRDERVGDAPLVVGGLSMGGLVTRYALARMESEVAEHGEHEVGTYFSFDSPHRGAWIPISLQCFAHFLAGLGDLVDEPQKSQLKAMSALINSPASRELLWRHTATHKNASGTAIGATFSADAKRGAFLEALEAVGSWPDTPTKIAVASGRGDGQGLEVTPGVENLVWTPTRGDNGLMGPGATLYAQNEGATQKVAELKRALSAGTFTIKTTGIPALDGAPGGTLDSFGIAKSELERAGYEATAAFPDVCFVPTASAVDLADPSDPFTPVDDLDQGSSGLQEYMVATDTDPAQWRHTLFTKELCDWLTERF